MKRDDASSTTIVVPQLKNAHLTESLVKEIRKHEKQVRILILVNDLEGFPIFEGADVLYTRDRNLSRSWNKGIRATRTPNIILMNNDVRCKGKFVEELSSLNDTHISGAKLRTDTIAPGMYLEGWCLSFSKVTWLAGCFNEEMSLYCSDTYFQYCAKKRGVLLNKCSLPLKHLEHKTAHDKRIVPDRIHRLLQDMKTLRKILRAEEKEDAKDQ